MIVIMLELQRVKLGVILHVQKVLINNNNIIIGNAKEAMRELTLGVKGIDIVD